MSEHELEDQALSQLKATHYKEAIQLFKKLLQMTDNEQWRQHLAHCYVQRSIQFATKGMYKEALVLWENQMQYAHSPYDAIDQYIIWLIQANKQADIQQNLAQLSAQQLDKNYLELAAVLGLLMLTEHPEFLQELPQDSMLFAHFSIARRALQALQDDKTQILSETLKQLPYRSAFRDFRTLMNAMLVMPDSMEQAQSLLVKIPDHSPYFHAAGTLLACTREGAELAQTLIQLSHGQCALIGKIKGLSKKQLDFIQHYGRQQDNLSDKVQFKLAIQYKSLLGTEFARYFCQAALARYPAGKKDFNKHFGDASQFEENRVKALICEQDGNIYDAENYWRRCLGYLNTEKADDNFRAALILRHLAAMEPVSEEQTDLLIESLDYDRDDRESYLQIVQYFSQQAETANEHKLWLAKTLKQFPQEIEVLIQAIKSATANKTYKKACQYATKILKIDSLNMFAKQTLFDSHIAHARRLMREKNYALVEKEIAQAEKLNLGKAYYKQLQLMRALLCFAEDDKQQGLKGIAEELGGLHANPVSALLQAGMEALLNGLPVATILRELNPAKDYLLTTRDLTAIVEQLKLYAIDDEALELLHKTLNKVKAPLKKSLSEQDYPEGLRLDFCQVLDTIQHFELLRYCTKSVPIVQQSGAIWIYYLIYANNNGNGQDCSPDDVLRLQLAYDQAENDKDFQTGLLIKGLLDDYYAVYEPRDESFLDELVAGFMGEEDVPDDDPLDALFGHIEHSVMMKLNNRAESIMKKLTPEKIIHKLIKKSTDKEAVLIAMMQNSDIFSALMLIKAAEELKINIGVGIDDVIHVFNINDNTQPTPLPF